MCPQVNIYKEFCGDSRRHNTYTCAYTSIYTFFLGKLTQSRDWAVIQLPHGKFKKRAESQSQIALTLLAIRESEVIKTGNT